MLFGAVCVLLFAGLSVSALVRRTKSKGKDVSSLKTADTPLQPPVLKLAELIKLPTVSFTDYGTIDKDAFAGMKNYLETNFPNLLRAAELIILNEFSYIVHWKGSDPELKPGLLLAHFDVVPADSGDWSVPPFEGRIQDGYVWGRGALDTKCTLIGMLEAAEQLVLNGFRPRRSWYLTSGGDEETFGIEGAQKIAAYFEKEGIRFEFVLDEGTIVSSGMLSDVQKPLALLGICEKGYADILLETEGPGGHASMPPAKNPATVLLRAVSRIEGRKKRRKITYSLKYFLHSLSPHVSFWKALVYSNIWLFSPVIKRIMDRSPQTRALVETTSALTIFSAGEKENVIPSHARAVYNVRILPGETVAGTMRKFVKLIRNPEVRVSLLDEREVNDPVSETSYEDEISRRIVGVIRKVFPEAVVAPFMSTVTTDSKYYQNLTDRIYRFVPMILTPEKLQRIHGVDERISFENLSYILHFYVTFIKEFS